MDEFRKPYEYDDEKRPGFLLIFVAMLLSTDLFLAITLTVQGYNAVSFMPAARVPFIVLNVSFILFAIYTAITCYRVKMHLVKISKAYLVTRAVFTIVSFIIIFLSDFNNKNLIGMGPGQYMNRTELTLQLLILPLAYTLVFSSGWYLYFLKSKKCKEIALKDA